MRGRCFDIEGNRWKQVTPFHATNVHVCFAGFSGYTGTLREHGWEFSLVENFFTKRKKLMMRNSALCLVGSGDYTEGAVVFVRSLQPAKFKGIPRLQDRGEIINLDKLETADLFDIILRRQKADAPKVKPQAEVIPIKQTA